MCDSHEPLCGYVFERDGQSFQCGRDAFAFIHDSESVEYEHAFVSADQQAAGTPSEGVFYFDPDKPEGERFEPAAGAPARGYFGPDQDAMRAALAEDAAKLDALMEHSDTPDSESTLLGEARAALVRLDARNGENVDEWARSLAADLCATAHCPVRVDTSTEQILGDA